MYFVILIISYLILCWLGSNIIRIFGNETFDENKVMGRTIRKTPEQKALRFKFYVTIVFILLFVIGIVIKLR